MKRFPERPPPRRSERMLAILEQIELWYITICRTARYKDDLGFIRDMHSLLFRKGYTFPTPKAEDVAVLGQGGTVQSAEELEQEDRLVQEAKLQELIRRGTPRDLEQANKLMKVLSGYDERNRTDYRAKAAEEVANVQEKAKLLEEMIQLQMSGDHAAEGDAYEVGLCFHLIFPPFRSRIINSFCVGIGECTHQCSPQDPKNVRRGVR